MNLRTEPGFLGTNAPMLADLTLLAYVLILVPAMLIGFYFARRKWFVPHHKLVMTGVMLINWVFILFVMAVSYSDAVAPNVPDNLNETTTLLPIVHLVFGALAQILATYLVGRMWFENILPDWTKVKNIKLYMRITLVLWIATAFLGVTLYINWYTPVSASNDTNITPVSTEEPSSGDSAAPVSTEEAITEDATEDPAETGDNTEDADESEPASTEEASDTSAEGASEDNPSEPASTEEASDASTDAAQPVTTEEPGN